MEPTQPVELIHDNRHRLSGLLVRTSAIQSDEVQTVHGIPVTTPARTALDLACWYPPRLAVPMLDALARVTGVKLADVYALLPRYPGRPGLERARVSLDLVDPGAQSPKESWVRVILVLVGMPKPTTQIRLYDDLTGRTAFLDMGWKDLKVAAEYDGDQHRTDLRQFRHDAVRREIIQRHDWICVTVIAGDREQDVIRRVRAARARRLPSASSAGTPPRR